MKLFLSPHNDDACLFAAFALQCERPLVLAVFDSHIQVSRGHANCDAARRRKEDLEAITMLGCGVAFGGVRDDEPAHSIRTRVHSALSHWSPSEVWLPEVEEGAHEQHNLVGEIGLEVFKGATIHRYLTYTRTHGKSTNGREVKPTGAMVLKKLQALACYRTQIEADALGCWPHFLDLREFCLD